MKWLIAEEIQRISLKGTLVRNYNGENQHNAYNIMYILALTSSHPPVYREKFLN